jgi:bacterioferritin-associated ferredoxin
MIVCNCRRINDAQVKAAIRGGIARWRDVHAHYGVEPCCGKCACEIRQAMAEHSVETQSSAPTFAAPAMAEPA